MKRKVFALSRMFSIVAWASMLSLGLTACTQDEIKDTDIYCAHEGHAHAVDLGLSVKWACCNVGATSPEEYGGYYAWGDPEKKESCIWTNYKWHNNNTGEMSKYNDKDGKTVLDPADDTAQALWGGEWRMPTQAEIQELMDRCTWTWTSVNGVYGYKVSGNGNSIFLPLQVLSTKTSTPAKAHRAATCQLRSTAATTNSRYAWDSTRRTATPSTATAAMVTPYVQSRNKTYKPYQQQSSEPFRARCLLFIYAPC